MCMRCMVESTSSEKIFLSARHLALAAPCNFLSLTETNWWIADGGTSKYAGEKPEMLTYMASIYDFKAKFIHSDNGNVFTRNGRDVLEDAGYKRFTSPSFCVISLNRRSSSFHVFNRSARLLLCFCQPRSPRAFLKNFLLYVKQTHGDCVPSEYAKVNKLFV